MAGMGGKLPLRGYSYRVSAYAKIDDVEPAPKLGNHGPNGWAFELFSNLSDEEAPHRVLLERLAAAEEGWSLTLPPVEPLEDFVEGSLRWGNHEVRVYYETTLSYLSLWSPEREAVAKLRSFILPLALAM